MKMDQKGLSTAAIVGIVVAVVAVVVVVAAAVIVLGPGGQAGVGTLPVYTGASKSSTAGSMGTASQFVKTGIGKENSGTISDEPTSLDDELYVAPAATTSVTDVMNWYKSNMASQGWTLLYEDSDDYSIWGFSVSCQTVSYSP